MKTILIFTKNESLRKYWQNALPEEYKVLPIESMKLLIRHLEKNGENILMIDEKSLENSAAILVKLSKFIKTKVMLFNNELDLEHVTSLLGYGIKAYENSYLNAETLKNVIRSVESGKIWLFVDFTSYLIMKYVKNRPSAENVDVEIFTNKEKEVLSCITYGLSNADIAKKLSISLSTVKVHISNIFEKADLHDRVNLALRYKGFV